MSRAVSEIIGGTVLRLVPAECLFTYISGILRLLQVTVCMDMDIEVEVDANTSQHMKKLNSCVLFYVY